MSQYLLIHLLFTATRHFATADGLSGCFLPNGTALPFSRAYQPCIVTQNIVSMCCVLNATALEALGESAANVDICLENGMCQPPAGSPGQYARNLCTDHTWKSPNCLNVCTDPSNGGTDSDTSFLTHCTDGSWCCGGSNTTCCNDNQGFQVASQIAPYINAVSTSIGTSTPTSTSASTSASGTSSASQTSNSSNTSSSPKPSSSSSTNGAAIGLGAALGVILLAAIAVGIFLWRKKKVTGKGPIELGPGRPIDSKNGYQVQDRRVGNGVVNGAPGYGPNEIVPAEMDGEAGMRYK